MMGVPTSETFEKIGQCLTTQLRSRFARNLGAMGIAQLVTRVSRLLTTIILARLLLPADYGMAAVVLTVYELVALFTRNGISAKVVQADASEVEAVAQTAYNLTWLVCGGLMLAQFALAVPLAQLYGNPDLALPIAMMGLIYLATPLCNIQAAFIQRDGRIGRIAFAGGLQVTVDNALTAIFALLGMGMWAILLPKLLVAPIWVIINRTGHAWRPRGGWSLAGWRDIARFSRNVLGIELMTTIQANIDNLIVGYFLGIEALGIYFFAFNGGLGITLGLINSFGVAVFPYLSEVRNDAAALAARYRQSLQSLGLIIVPLVLLQSLLAPFYVPIVFGTKWVEAIPVLMIICLSALARPFASTCEQLLKTVGRPDIALRWQTTLTVLLVVGLVTGAQFGLVWVAVAVALVQTSVLTAYCLLAPRRFLAQATAIGFEIVTTEARMLALRPEWDALWACADAPYLSQSFAWCLAGWRTTGAPRGRRLQIVVQRVDGRAVLIWPMTRQRRLLGWVSRALGAESSEYAPVLVEAGADATAHIAAAWRFVSSQCGADVVTLPHVRDGAALAETMGANATATETLPAPSLVWTAGQSWDEYWRSLTPGFRRGLERRQRRLAEAGKVVTVMATDPVDFQTGIDFALRHKIAWMARKSVGNDYLPTPEYRAFLMVLAGMPSSAGCLAVFTLQLDGKIIAAKIGMVDGARFEGFITVHEPDYAAFSPGQVILAACLRWCHDQGLGYDFRIGEEAYKRDWANGMTMVTSYAVATTKHGALLLAVDRAAHTLRESIDRVRIAVPKIWRARIRAICGLHRRICFPFVQTSDAG